MENFNKCFGCGNIEVISKTENYEVNFDKGNIVKYTYRDVGLKPEFLLVPKGVHLRDICRVIVIYYCPWCGKLLK